MPFSSNSRVLWFGAFSVFRESTFILFGRLRTRLGCVSKCSCYTRLLLDRGAYLSLVLFFLSYRRRFGPLGMAVKEEIALRMIRDDANYHYEVYLALPTRVRAADISAKQADDGSTARRRLGCILLARIRDQQKPKTSSCLSP